MIRMFIVVTGLSILVSACELSEREVQTAIAQTRAAMPTATKTTTSTPSLTATSSHTPTATITPSLTLTDMHTPTATKPSATPTVTPLPDLESLALSFRDLSSVIPNVFSSGHDDDSDLYSSLKEHGAIDVHARTYRSRDLLDPIGWISILMYRVEDSQQAQEQVDLSRANYLETMKEFYNLISPTSTANMPSNAILAIDKVLASEIVIEYSQGEVKVTMSLTKSSLSPITNDDIDHLIELANIQRQHLLEGGFADAPTVEPTSTLTPDSSGVTAVPTSDSASVTTVVPVSSNAPTSILAASPIPTEAAPPTQTSVPTETSLPTQTPEISLTQTAQAFGPLITPKGNGTFTVGVTIAPGRWESQGTFSSCYWERLGGGQNILDNHFGFAGGTVTIQPSDHQVVFNSCGTWEYVEGRPTVLEADATIPKSDGFFTVGIEIATGRWESTGAGGSCYWERRDAFQGVIDNHFGSAGGTVTVQASDYEVNFNGCGTWVYLEGQSGVPQADPTAPRGDGFYTVGAEIATGQWRSTGAGGSCYWERRDVNQNIIDNYFGAAGVTMGVSGSDYEINFNGCGTWEYLGP